MNKIINSIYSPPRKKHSITLKDFYKGKKQVLYFSLARHALKQGLLSMGLKAGDNVLLPSFICRDVLAPFNELGLCINFYNVNELLQPLNLENEVKAKAIFVVNYFGFETYLSSFLEYCKKNNSLLIEDNAHGLFSKSKDGLFLGQRGDLGVVSVRKSLPVENGAILFQGPDNKSLQLEIITHSSIRLFVKKTMRLFVRLLGINFFLTLTKLKRRLRKSIYGTEVPVSSNEDELIIPMSPNPADIDKYFLTIDIDNEILRRRELFKLVGRILKSDHVRPYREQLEAGEVPYGFPFFCEQNEVERIKEKLKNNNLEIVNWPDLPSHLVENVPAFYKNLYIVKFLW
ncbi:MAG: DegT/DnrJ/EryC1/StrS family aminotransferase [Bacteriovorax sp.]|nr:DegT/DnrJ/EryC1/StrS family aminotransferase [Bacteriovorax sp.]